ncbi:MAG: LysR family transcriptional regulator [Sphingomonas sp.]|uniref:LysR family transcriptional regulator n=1 Tax=Sphingomonas sp. TaxID=28214 RepID=UPI001818375E|nr:LysR family transcriptional regulator [Sphingomonas sp.]MBA3666431.1 LysR family transcriptional regulator [Sphingomonas sp.]
MIDWNDLRYFLAVAEGGSTLAAGRALRVSQTTVARRIAALEQAVGFPLFDRRQAGYAPTAAGETLIDRAKAMSKAADGFAEAAAAEARNVSGTVRLTTEEIFAHALLTPMLAELHGRHPKVRIEIDTARGIRDLGAGEADIALRSTSYAMPAGVVGRRLCDDDWTLYCSRDYADRNGVPRTKSELKSHALVGGGGGNLGRAYEAFLEELGLTGQVVIHQGSSTGLLSGVRSGLGIGVLPCLVAEGEPDLVRCLPPRRDHGRKLWLLTHERVRHAPRVRLAIDFLYERLKQRVSDLNLAT